MTPSCDIPEIIAKKKNGKLSICNRQETPKDSLAAVRVFSNTDDLMIRVMQKLGFPIPEFVLRRRLVVELESKGDRHKLKLYGVDVDGTPLTFLKSVKCEYNRRGVKSEPFLINFKEELELGAKLKLELESMGHYGEPNVEVEFVYTGEEFSKELYLLEYNPQTGIWRVRKDGKEFDDVDAVDVQNLTL